jgi:hypothetical protein
MAHHLLRLLRKAWQGRTLRRDGWRCQLGAQLGGCRLLHLWVPLRLLLLRLRLFLCRLPLRLLLLLRWLVLRRCSLGGRPVLTLAACIHRIYSGGLSALRRPAAHFRRPPGQKSCSG